MFLEISLIGYLTCVFDWEIVWFRGLWGCCGSFRADTGPKKLLESMRHDLCIFIGFGFLETLSFGKRGYMVALERGNSRK